MKYMLWLLKRVREPSTLAGISAIGLMFGLPPGTIDAAAQVIAGAASILAIVVPEAKPNA